MSFYLFISLLEVYFVFRHLFQMAWDKRKVVVQSDNATRHSMRQKCTRPLIQSRSGVVISEPTKRHVTSQAKHVEARMKACVDRPTTTRTEAMHIKVRTKARFDCSITLTTIRPTTTPPYPRAAPLLRAQHVLHF